MPNPNIKFGFKNIFLDYKIVVQQEDHARAEKFSYDSLLFKIRVIPKGKKPYPRLDSLYDALESASTTVFQEIQNRFSTANHEHQVYFCVEEADIVKYVILELSNEVA